MSTILVPTRLAFLVHLILLQPCGICKSLPDLTQTLHGADEVMTWVEWCRALTQS